MRPTGNKLLRILTHPAWALLAPVYICLWVIAPSNPRDGWAWVKVPFVDRQGWLGGVADPASVGPVEFYAYDATAGPVVLTQNDVIRGLAPKPQADAMFTVTGWKRRTGVWIVDSLRTHATTYWYRRRTDGAEVPPEDRTRYLAAAVPVMESKIGEWQPYQLLAQVVREQLAREAPPRIEVNPVRRAANTLLTSIVLPCAASLVRLLFSIPGRLRARVARRKLQCTACGYSRVGLSGPLCPECGVTRS